MKKLLSVLFLLSLIFINTIYASEIPAADTVTTTPQEASQTTSEENILTDIQENIDESSFEDDYTDEIIMEAPTVSMSTGSKFITGLSITLAIIGIILIVLAIMIIKKI